MLDIIKELRNEHTMIIDEILNIEWLGIYSKEGKIKLFTAKRDILAHLEKEDKKLYPVLRKAAKSNKKFKEKLDYFSKKEEKVTEFALQFFDTYSAASSGIEYKLDCERLYSSLKVRILKMEFLFKEYKELKQ
jgi:hypothetical protein